MHVRILRLLGVVRDGADWVVTNRGVVQVVACVAVVALLFVGLAVGSNERSADVVRSFTVGVPAPVRPADRVLKARAEAILARLGSPQTRVVVSDSACGPSAAAGYVKIACANIGIDRVIWIRSNAEKLAAGSISLPQILAHELMHERTTLADEIPLMIAGSLLGWHTHVQGDDDPNEVIADCGAPLELLAAGYPRSILRPGPYVANCSPTETAVAAAVIVG